MSPAILLVLGFGEQNPSNKRIAFCVSSMITGIFFMAASDAQKYFTLKHKPGLISDGMFKLTRSPNFFGEFLIYLSFVACVGIFEVYLGYFVVLIVIYGSFIVIKEESNSKKKG